MNLAFVDEGLKMQLMCLNHRNLEMDDKEWMEMASA